MTTPATATVSPATPASRRHDLDWLRVVAFGLLIFYHIGMFYVSWGWHVKSRYAGGSGEGLMLLLNPWRLSLLFFISGVAVKFLIGKVGSRSFMRSRFKRIFIPLVFGMLVIVPPQTYFELQRLGELDGGLARFYLNYLTLDQLYSVITPTWNHLWYLAYILVYSLTLALMLRAVPFGVRAGTQRLFERLMRGPFVILVPAAIFILYRFTLVPYFPTTHDLVSDWASHANYFTVFMLGYGAAKSDVFWTRIRALRWLTLASALLLGAALSLAWANWDMVSANSLMLQAAQAGRVLYAWLVILALLGLAQAHINRPGRVLGYLGEAVYPYYILHQTIIILIGVWLTPMALGGGLEFILLTLSTTLGCALLYEYIIRRSSLLRPLFGLKAVPASKQPLLASAGSAVQD